MIKCVNSIHISVNKEQCHDIACELNTHISYKGTVS